MVKRKGAFRRFMRGLAAAHEAGLKMRVNCVLSNRNAHERDAMRAIADRYGVPSFEYTNITPTIHGTGEVPGRPPRRGSGRAASARRRRGRAHHTARRVLGLRPSKDLWDLHAAGEPLPAGEGPA